MQQGRPADDNNSDINNVAWEEKFNEATRHMPVRVTMLQAPRVQAPLCEASVTGRDIRALS
eukprot:8611295-Pyramimonas_sp.AAC.1